MRLNLSRAIISLTGALDFVGVDEVHHAQRVALLAHSLAQELGWSAERCRFIVFAGMLHDCGVARVREHRSLTATLEWDGSEYHCVRGHQYLSECPPLAMYAEPVRWHHTRWSELDRRQLSADACLASNLIFLADRLDVLLAPYLVSGSLKSELLWEYPQLIERLCALRESHFAPELLAALRRCAARESFWLQCDPAYVIGELEDCLDAFADDYLEGEDVLAFAALFARTVDSKSVYTLDHSTRVAALARYLGKLSGLDGTRLDMLEVAALLHDIGKLRVPEDIIDKPGKISEQERAIVRRHSFDTGRILRKVFPGLPIAEWAAMHHEDLSGSGYPSQIGATEIPFEARLIAVADIFQALSQARPYRAPLPPEGVMKHLEGMVAAGRIDAHLTALVRANLDACYRLAVPAELLETA